MKQSVIVIGRVQEGMVEMGFQPSEADADCLFPKDVKMTSSDFMRGIVFDDEAPSQDDDQSTTTTTTTNNNNYNTARKRTKEFFRRYIDDVYNGKEGTL